MRIQQLKFSEILDSRGVPTVEATVILEGGAIGIMGVPSGKSVGTHEALEKRDAHLSRYHGKGLQDCLEFAQNMLRDELVGRSFTDFRALDIRMIEIDGTPQKSNGGVTEVTPNSRVKPRDPSIKSNTNIELILDQVGDTSRCSRIGSNFILGISGAFAKACAHHHRMPLYQYLSHIANVALPEHMPKPMVNVINGGAHADNNLAIQEFMLVPIKRRPFCEYIRMISEIFYILKGLLHKKGLSTNVGDEGGFAPLIQRTQEVFDLLSETTQKAGYRLGEDIGFALDCAANHFYKDGRYILDQESLPVSEYIDVLSYFCQQYPIVSIEDPIIEDDFEAWQQITKALSGCMIVGDDIFVTQEKRLRKGIACGAANAILIKPNQVGTLTETLKTIDVAKEYGYDTIVSHRSGETTDTFIADFAYAVAAPYVKFGSVSRGERVCKYNRLQRFALTHDFAVN